MEVGNMNGVYPHLLEYRDEVRNALELPFERFHGERHVIMAGQGDMARQLRKMIFVRIEECFPEGIRAPSPGEQVKDTESLGGSRWGVEPRFESTAPLRDLPDTEPKGGRRSVMTSAKPDKLEVIGPIPREMELVWRRKAGQGAALVLCQNGPVTDRQGLLAVELFEALTLWVAARICPTDGLPSRGVTGQARLVNKGHLVLGRRDHGFDLHQPV